MSESTLPILYAFRRCPYAMRARLALVASGQRCELREVVLRDKPAELLAASPKATVPVLVLPGGAVLEQSLDIMQWALDLHDPLHWLAPSHGTPEAMHALVARCDGEFKRLLDRYKYPSRHASESGTGTGLSDTSTNKSDTGVAARDLGAAFLQDLDARLQAAPHLFGTHITLADAAIFPFVRQFAMVDPAWFDSCPWPRLHAWLAAWLGSDAFARAMHKYAQWHAGAPRVEFPPA